MNLYYKSTRDSSLRVTASQAVLMGLAPDGGLFVPEEIPSLGVDLERLSSMTYQETALEVLKHFLADYTEEELRDCISKAYDEKFDTEVIAPLAKAGGVYYLELFHGPTIAFKDMALSILPHLMTTAARKNQVDKEIVILTATSGDTGKAAMAGFADVPGTRIIVFYPRDGVSQVQKLQMITQKGDNVDVVAVKGNFDDAQSGVKTLFEDRELAGRLAAKGCQFSSANSINIGRLAPQIVYYVYAYGRLLENEEIKAGEKINVVVPTGNFGNILAAYYAKQMGLPIDRLICASNDNKVLYDFFQTGVYDKDRDFLVTISPSMDILISSNLERLIYEISGRDDQKTRGKMEELKAAGHYAISPEMREGLADFQAGYAIEEETLAQIRRVYEKTGYLIEPHTAVASKVCEDVKSRAEEEGKYLVASTASPYKFVKSVLTALDEGYQDWEELKLLPELEKVSGVEMPRAIQEILTASPRHCGECAPDKMKETVEEILGLREEQE